MPTTLWKFLNLKQMKWLETEIMWICGDLRNKIREITSGELIFCRNQAFETNVRLGQLLSRVVPDVEFQKKSTKGISPFSSKRIKGTAQFFWVTVLFECNVRTSNWMRKNWNRNISKNRGFRFKSINTTLSKLLDSHHMVVWYCGSSRALQKRKMQN